MRIRIIKRPAVVKWFYFTETNYYAWNKKYLRILQCCVDCDFPSFIHSFSIYLNFVRLPRFLCSLRNKLNMTITMLHLYGSVNSNIQSSQSIWQTKKRKRKRKYEPTIHTNRQANWMEQQQQQKTKRHILFFYFIHQKSKKRTKKN